MCSFQMGISRDHEMMNWALESLKTLLVTGLVQRSQTIPLNPIDNLVSQVLINNLVQGQEQERTMLPSC